MLLSVSNLIFCQSTDTKNTKVEIPESQVKEIYKGLKQNEYLKSRLQKTESTLTSANQLISEQEKALAVSKSLLQSKDDIIITKDEILKQEKVAGIERENQLRSDFSILQSDYKILQIDSKTKQRKKFWNGIKIGGVSVAILGVGAFLLINR